MNVPYGYRKNPEDGKGWIIDEEAADVVRHIFDLCMEGRGPMQIARQLTKEQVLNPTAYKDREGIRSPHPETADPYHWSTSTVIHILERQEYTGCTVNFKTYTNSIWGKKQRENPQENRAVFYNTHPAIIEPEVFDKVQEIRQQRHRRTKTGKSHMFSGLVFCADCKARMYYCTASSYEDRQDSFVCGSYRKNSRICSAHFIRAVVLEKLVWEHMREVIWHVTRFEAYFRAKTESRLRMETEEALRSKRKQLDKAEKRMQELDRLFVRLYEDNAMGKLSDERYEMMSRTYEDEQESLKADMEGLRQEIDTQEQQNRNLDQFIQKIKTYSDLDELTAYAVHDLIRAIYVGAPDRSSGKRRQSIHICYDLIGFIPLDELMEQEMA